MVLDLNGGLGLAVLYLQAVSNTGCFSGLRLFGFHLGGRTGKQDPCFSQGQELQAASCSSSLQLTVFIAAQASLTGTLNSSPEVNYMRPL